MLSPYVVVLVPGILGSVLQRGGREVWGLSRGTLFKTLLSLGRSLEDLAIQGDGDDGVTATALLPDTHMIPGFWKVDGYTRIREYLLGLGLQAGLNYREFPYDWRRDNRAHAGRLATEAEGWLAEWQRHLGASQKAKLILIGHSMGGLVSRHYVEVLGGHETTHAVLTFGTPYYGSLNALDVLVNGVAPWPVADLRALARTLPSVHQLLPMFPCIVDDTDPTGRRHAHIDASLGLDADRLADARAFHQTIARNANARKVAFRPVVGNEQPTRQSARRRPGGGLEMLETLALEDTGGDGTVPRISAIPPGFRADDPAIVFSSEMHASLQNASHVLAQVRGFLTGQVDDLDRLRDLSFQPPPGALRLKVPDSVEGPLPIRVWGPADAAVVATVTDVDTGTTTPLTLERTDDGHGAEVQLPPGVYRVTVGGGDGSLLLPTSDLSVVWPPAASGGA